MNIFSSFVFFLVLISFADSSNLLILDESNFERTLNQSEYVFIAFISPTCPHCKNLKPEFEKASELIQDINSNVIYAEIDATVNRNVSKLYNITKYPVLLLFKNGAVIDYFSGSRNSEQILDWTLSLTNKVKNFYFF